MHMTVTVPCLFCLFYRLFIFGSYDREANVHCTLELSSGVWEEKQRSSIKTVKWVVLHLCKIYSVSMSLLVLPYS